MSESQSILSHGESTVAAMLADGMQPEEIAAERDVSPEEMEKSIDRIREKTERAVTTLAESPFTAEVASEMNDETREDVLDALDN